MKHKILILSLSLQTIILTIVFYGVYNYYAPPRLRKAYQLSCHKNDTLRIAYIGDSWAFMHKDHECLIPELLSDTLHCPVKVYSHGISGLTSKEVYESLYSDYGLKKFFQQVKYDYCFVSVGINDTYKKMGTNYYRKSIDGIIQFLLANNIQPIILEIPDYNILKAYKYQKTKKKILRRLSMLINGTTIDCKQDFRDVLDELIQEKGYQYKISVIRYKSWNSTYKNDLKFLYLNDGMHLNKYGYGILDSIIAKIIIKKSLSQ